MVYELIYFPIRGRIEAIRLLCVDNGLEYKDVKVTDWGSGEMKKTMMFGQLPCVRDGDKELVQSNAILRYMARKHGLYGKNDWEKTMVDMVNDSQEDLRMMYTAMIYQNYENGKKTLIDSLPGRFQNFENVLRKNNEGKGFFVGDQINFVDYNMFDLLDNLLVLAPDCLDKFPLLKSFYERIGCHEKIAKYRATVDFKALKINGNGKQ